MDISLMGHSPKGQATQKEMMPNSLVILDLQGAGHLLSCGQGDRSCPGGDRGEVPWPVQELHSCVYSGVGVSGEIGASREARARVSASAHRGRGRGWGRSLFSRLSPEASGKQPWHTSSFPRTPPTCPATCPAKGLHVPPRPSSLVLQQPKPGTCPKPFLRSSPLDNIYTFSIPKPAPCFLLQAAFPNCPPPICPFPFLSSGSRLQRPASHLPWGTLPRARKLKVASGWDLGFTPASSVVPGKLLRSPEPSFRPLQTGSASA